MILPNNKLSIADISVYYPPGDILTLTANNATFFWIATSPNGGQYARTLYLISKRFLPAFSWCKELKAIMPDGQYLCSIWCAKGYGVVTCITTY